MSSAFTFRPATRENVGLIIGLVGASGGGKTFTAMRLATGLAGGKKFCVIDTEAGRAKHYADQFSFDHCDFTPPFSPARYAQAIHAANEAHYPVIVVDSFSHEHAGEGGILSMQEEEFERLGRKDAVKMLSWVKPKTQHKRMVQDLLQSRAHLILCFRAEEKIEMVREGNTTKVVPKVTRTGIDGWVPVCEKTLPFELTTSILLLPDKPGIPRPIKLQEQHRHLFPLDKPITEATGAALAEWARGGTPAPPRPVAAPQRIAPEQAAAPQSDAQRSAPTSPWRGLICDTREETSGGKTVFVVVGENGISFKSTDRQHRVVADQLAGQPAVIEFTVRPTGALMVTSIKAGRPGG